MNVKNWQVLALDKEEAAGLAEQYGLPSIVAMLLQVRGMGAPDKIDGILGQSAQLADPFEVRDMDKAVARIQRSIDEFEKIAVYGDYDADGITATAILYTYLQSAGADVMYYIPMREGEGYGMNAAAVCKLAEAGVSLIITVDNGISSADEVALAAEKGIDVVITDHHKPQPRLPKAVAVVDPHRADCPSLFKDYSGAGLALKLVMALEAEICDAADILDTYADLAAIGTIGDVVPLTGENRSIVRHGLMRLEETDREGILCLAESAGITAYTANSVAFTLVPRINATGRMGAPDRAVELLVTEYRDDALVLAESICKDNEDRRATEGEISEAAVRMIESDDKLKYSRVLVVDGPDWHPGVLGIVAARLMDRYGKPAIVISKSGDEARGSGRSFAGFSLFDAVSACGEYLTRFGGHPLAAGISLESVQIEGFRAAVNAYAEAHCPVMPSQCVTIDCKLLPRALSPELPRMLAALEPFGSGNPSPVFGLFSMTLTDIAPVGGGNHLRLGFQRDDTSVTCMKFGCRAEQFPYSVGAVLDLAVSLENKTFRGTESLTVLLREMRPAGFDSQAAAASYRWYEQFCCRRPMPPEAIDEITPERSDLADIYRTLRAQGGWSLGALQLLTVLPQKSISLGKLLIALAILKERGLITMEMGEILNIRLTPTDGKTDIFQSEIYKILHTLRKEENHGSEGPKL